MKDIKDCVDKNKIKISTEITKNEVFPKSLDKDVFLIVIGKTEEMSHINGLLLLGNESNKDKKRNRDSDIKSHKASWKIVCDMPISSSELEYDLDKISTFDKVPQNFAIDIALKMLFNECELEDKFNLAKPDDFKEENSDNFFDFAKQKLIEDNLWAKSKTSRKKSNATATKQEGQAPKYENNNEQDSSKQAETANNKEKQDENNFYGDLQNMTSNPSGKQDQNSKVILNLNL